MSSRDEITLPATRPKSRKSLGHVPSAQDVDQENQTADVGLLVSGKRTPMEKSRKSRSKSIGPGGLDALKDTSGNRRKSLAAIPHPPPKSILKPTMPPLREIPAHISTRKGSPKKPTPQSSQKTENLIDFDFDLPSGPTISGTDRLANPFEVGGSPAVNETRVTLRTEEEQQAAAREREEKERQELEKEIISRRDARRKSLANRRVSFAPEATLHTWDVVVEYQDSTTSSNATNSTRRASSVTGGTVGSPHPAGPPSSDPSDPPSTPPEHVEEDTVKASPAHQRDLHQKKRRRSSGIPPMNFNNPDDEVFSSSPLSGSSDAEEAVDDDIASNSNSDSGDDGTMMSLDGGETTNMSMASINSSDSTDSSTRLEEALRQAARQAGTQGIDSDENGDENMVEEEEEVVASFAPWKKPNAIQNLESQQDQENVNPFSPAFKEAAPPEEEQSEGEEVTMDMTHAVGGILPSQKPDKDEMSMDVTRAFGGIITNDAPKATNSRRKSMAAGRRQSTRRRSSGESSSLGDETMEFTMAMGGIQPSHDETVSKDDEDMTMEFTSVVGGVLAQYNGSSKPIRRASMAATQRGQPKKSRESIESSAEDETMDMAVAMGAIMPSIAEATSQQDDATIGMEMTTALGGILPPQMSTGSRSQAKKIMEMETDLGSSPFRAEVPQNSPPKLPAPTHTVASETGSPSLAGFRGKGLRRSAEARHSTTPKSRLSSGGTPLKKPSTPSKQLTPQPPRPTTPGKTPPSKNVIMRTASPKRLFKDEIKASSTPQSAAAKKATTPNKLFQQNKSTGAATPSFILTPQPRRSSGIGLDKLGLGSPRVAALLDRRGSIGEHAKSFVPSRLEETAARGVRFDDPRAMENEIDQEREQEGNREDGRKILEREADQAEEEKDATINLKEMIQSLTPKKKPLRGRKSLHVGAAKGILGKRPAELDDDDEEDDNGGVKRLKGHQGSPVKAVHLQAPPTKAETTTGRMTRSARKSMEEATFSSLTPTTTSPEKVKATTPRHQGRFKDAEALAPTANIGQPVEKEPVDEPEISEESFGDDRIQLQDFLNMTSIRFMELTTTKRRHTIAPKAAAKEGDSTKSVSLEDCVAAGAATIPMLELFQHACHELKRYISEGRKTVREIETETFEENPPLFREYISASPDIKIVMDNQLKNVKTHARLLSKGQWYDWRMTLLATLKEGLFKTAEGMIQDEETLDQQQELLDTVLPHLIRQFEQLQREEGELQYAADEIANCDQEELSNARQHLITLDAEVEAKKQLIADLRRQVQGKEAEIEAGTERKQAWEEEIREAEKIREECRGWTSSEISILKGKVDAIEKEHGWTITGVSGTTTSMTYQKEIELVFDASSFLGAASSTSKKSENARIDLWYIGANRELNALPLTPEKEFFLQCIRDHIRGLPQAQTAVKDLLSAVSVSWNKANKVVDDIQSLNVSCPTEILKTSDDSIMVKSTLLISPLTTKVEIIFHLSSQSGETGIDVGIAPVATVVYGERFNEPKMGEFLLNRCGDEVEEKGQSSRSSWVSAVAELGEKLLARGRK
ncbi:Spc7-domain-containing protein [Mollisia scopiformis]|uniref:Spc7-domain-containing protein n=1 Tax=Mollisia scopiformis TaxID=149040 RepID=A0A194XUC1_MOLSC|nr:Spc7-domain-containing protein [Mollisia scopiformis]KUJ23736.1 Spc7-domain-containing protein [Mollisia scopiformis]